MKRIGISFLGLTATLIAAALLSCGARGAARAADASRAATFVAISGRETLFVERVRDVPGGFQGEVSLKPGTVWIRYRVELGPDETVRRYQLEMTSMVGSEPGEMPRPLLVARRTSDSVLIESEPGAGFPGRRIEVPPTALIGSTEMAMFEQALRYGLRHPGERTEFSLVSAWTGHSLRAAVVRMGRDRARLETGRDAWEFTLDARRRIVRGAPVSGIGDRGTRGAGVTIVRLDPSSDHPLHRPLSIGESKEGRLHDRLDSLRHAWDERESAFRATLESGRPTDELVAALDRHITSFTDRGGVYQAEKCLEVAAVMRDLPDGQAVAERFARRAIACAESHDQNRFGDQGLTAARARSHMMLAGIEADLGRQDSALARLDQVMALPLELEFQGRNLRRDARMTRAIILERDHLEQAVLALFEAVSLDMGPDSVSATVTVPLRRMWRRLAGEDTSLAMRIRNARTWQWAQATRGGGVRTLKTVRAPEWSCRDLTGRVRRSSELAGKPFLVLFWGGWTDLNRLALREADTWHRRREQTGVEVITANWELPGRGPLSERLARERVSNDGIAVPVLLDHDRRLFEAFGADAYPQMFLVDRAGRLIRTSWGVSAMRDSLADRIAALGRPARR